MSSHPDLRPAAGHMAALVEGVPGDSLDRPTPCRHYTVGDLLDHIGGLALAFIAAARKEPLEGDPSGDAASLAPDWKMRSPRDLLAMANAWDGADAWTGSTAAEGLFGPLVPVPDDAPLFDRLLGGAGRHPGWEPLR